MHTCTHAHMHTQCIRACIHTHIHAYTCYTRIQLLYYAYTRIHTHRTAAQNVALRGHSGAVNAVAIAPDGRKIFSGGRDKALNVWGVDDTHQAWDVSEGFARMQVLSVCERLCVCACLSTCVCRHVCSVCMRTRAHTHTPTLSHTQHTHTPMAPCARTQKQIMRQLAKKPVIPGSAVTCLCMAANGGYLAIGYADGALELMRSETLSVDQKKLAHPPAAHGEGGGVVCVAFSRDSVWLATCGGDRVVLLFRAHYVSNSPRSRQLYGKNAGFSLLLLLLFLLLLLLLSLSLARSFLRPSVPPPLPACPPPLPSRLPPLLSPPSLSSSLPPSLTPSAFLLVPVINIPGPHTNAIIVLQVLMKSRALSAEYLLGLQHSVLSALKCARFTVH